MPTTFTQKLKIKDGYTLLTLHPPLDFESSLGELPAGVTITEKAKAYNQIHWFVKDKGQLNEELERVLQWLKDGVTLWFYFPKGSSKIQTDLTRDKGWENLYQHKDLQWLTLISFNETWSAFSARLQNKDDKKKATLPKERPIFQYIDAVNKRVFLPQDFDLALLEHKAEKSFFDSLSFSNKKEYLEWIITAKKEETRVSRIQESIQRLGKGWKNPANR